MKGRASAIPKMFMTYEQTSKRPNGNCQRESFKIITDEHLEIIFANPIEDIHSTRKFNHLQNQQMANLDVTGVHRHLTHWQNLRPIVTVIRSI